MAQVGVSTENRQWTVLEERRPNSSLNRCYSRVVVVLQAEKQIRCRVLTVAVLMSSNPSSGRLESGIQEQTTSSARPSPTHSSHPARANRNLGHRQHETPETHSSCKTPRPFPRRPQLHTTTASPSAPPTNPLVLPAACHLPVHSPPHTNVAGTQHPNTQPRARPPGAAPDVACPALPQSHTSC